MSIRATVLAALTILLTNAGVDFAHQGSEQQYVPVAEPAKNVTLTQAIAAATQILAGEILEAEVKNKNGAPIWAIEIVPSDSTPQKLDDDGTRERAAERNSKIKLEDAVAIAEKTIPDGRAIDAEIDTQNGVPVYIIEIDKSGVWAVHVDLETGKVITVEAAGADDAGDAHEPLDPQDSDENADE